MTIEPGRTLQHYRLVEKIGEGGMGEVWLGRDVRLERDVAVKILPPGFASNEQFRARFEREGKTISSLNHPNICTLFDVGSEGEVHYLVMERLEGESLSDRIATRGALPLDDVLEIGAQIASALAAAHRAGVTHRDLKPDNVMLTRAGGAKLLDFGLAKTATESAPPIDGLTSAPTEAKPLTVEGMILGTFQYMAPEQLEGLEADARTDVFALGALLYEMATGKRAFEGKTKTSLIAAIVTQQPPAISSVVDSITPPALDHVVGRCLEKAPDDRWQSASDVAAQLRWISTGASQITSAPAAVPSPASRRKPLLPWVIAGALAVVSLALLVLLQQGRETPGVLRASLSPPPKTALIPFDLLGSALSPDGKRFAFAANDADGGKRLWIRELASMTAEPVPETEGARYPFWSPDGNHIGFFTSDSLKRIDLRGGSPRELAPAPSGRGASWGTDGVILFAPNITTAIHSVPAEGGEVRPVTRFQADLETTQRWPHFLPDGRHFIYVSRASNPELGDIGKLMLASLDDPTPRPLIDDSTNAVYVEPGYVLFGRSGDLLARPFDLGSLDFTGDAVPLIAEKAGFWEAKNYVPFTASDQGTLIYLPEFARQTTLHLYDRDGLPLQSLGKPGFHIAPRFSHDGARIAVVRGKFNFTQQDIWVHDLAQEREYRVTFETGSYENPTFSPDGTRLAFSCLNEGTRDICVKTLGTAGGNELLFSSQDWSGISDWMPDGSAVLFTEQLAETGNDIWLVELDKPDGARVLVATAFDELTPHASPDGQWLAYTSNETGRSEVYVRQLREDSQPWQVSKDGGWTPRWSGDGRELFFVQPEGQVMVAKIELAPVFRAGTPEALFTLPEVPTENSPLFEDLSPDGERFLLDLPVESRASVSFHALFGWPELLE